MPTRTPYTYSAATGDVLTAANVQKIPGGLIGYVSNTTDYTLNQTTGTEICKVSLTLQARTYIIQGQVPYSYTTDFSTNGVIELYDSVAGTIQLAAMVPFTPAPNGHSPIIFVVLKVTTADTSARDIKLLAWAGNGGTHKVDAQAGRPSTLTVYDAGPSF